MTDGMHIGREDERKRNIGTEKKGGREEQRKGAEGTRNDARRPCPRRRRAAVLPRGAGRQQIATSRADSPHMQFPIRRNG